MSECRLYQEAEHFHFITRRFDRDINTGKKIHMQTLGALAHYDYNTPGVHSYEQVAQIIYKLGMGQKEIEQLFRRMVLNVIACNQDDHVKNISFLMDGKGAWSLSPAYDVTFAYEPNNFWLSKHQMSINGKLESLDVKDLFECGRTMNINKNKITNIITEVSDAVSNWNIYAEHAHLDEKIAKHVQMHHRNIKA